MARAIADIKKQATDVFLDDENIKTAYGLTEGQSFEQQFSPVSIESILFYITAYMVWVLETIFDTFRSDVTAYVATMKPHSLKWYVQKALAYQHGFALLADSDQFDNTGKTDEQIATSKVVAYAAVVEQTDVYGRGLLRIKVAGNVGEDLDALPAEELAGFINYMGRVKDAGVHLNVTSAAPDSLKLAITVYYDPLVLASNGDRLDETDTNVVTKAIRAYLKQLPFNGVLVLQYLDDYIQQVDGVVISNITLAQSKYAAFPFTDIKVMTTPDAGYLRIADADLDIDYVAQSPIK